MLLSRFWPGRGGAMPPATEAGGFTAHNIRLDDGSETRPGTGLIADGPWCLATKRLLNVLFPEGVAGKRIVDLGCLEGGYAVEFARMGMESLGLEVRQSNFDNCLYVKERLGLPNLRFVKDNAWNVANYGRFDVVFCCGLLYHLDRPIEYIKTLSTIANKAVILNTHFATDHEIRQFNLSRLSINEGIKGRWYREFTSLKTFAQEDSKWASWDNARSFWIKHEYIPQVLRESGFDMVFEQFDAIPDPIAAELGKRERNRGMFVGVRVGSD
jgi:SAM-dependent methyltransferase